MNCPEQVYVFVGPSGAGKDSASERMQALTGADYHSLSFVVRHEAQKAGLINPSRGDLQLLANQRRSQHGDGFFAKVGMQEIFKKGAKRLIVTGVRLGAEIDAVREECPNSRVTVISIDAPLEERWERVRLRNRPSDPKSWAEFLVCDKREMGGTSGLHGQNNQECMQRADVTLVNRDIIAKLNANIDLLTDRLLNGFCTREFRQICQLPDQRTPLITVNGKHASGKTTIGMEIAHKLDLTYHNEIGAALRQQVTYDVSQAVEEFDREVMRLELLRDTKIRLDHSDKAHVVETWHHGNIAYARIRSPRVASQYGPLLASQLDSFAITPLFLHIDDQTFRARATEPIASGSLDDLVAFYSRVATHTRDAYSHYCFPKPIIINNSAHLQHLAPEAAIEAAQRHLVLVA